jgi:prepilin-type N-terminal cleavage/methylation domain-containing protein
MFRPIPNRAAGYSMAEVLVVLVLMGILASIAIPRMDISGFQSDGGVQTVASTLMAAQRAAVARQHDVVVAFDVAGRRLRVHDDVNGNGDIDAGEAVRWVELGDGAVFGRGTAAVHSQLGADAVSFTEQQGGLPAVTFFRAGSASQEGGAYVTSARAEAQGHNATATRAVVVDRSTGRTGWWKHGSGGWERGF